MGWSRPAKTAAFAGVAALAILLSLGVTDARVAYNVNYEGKVIATVSQKRSFSSAVRLLNSMVQGDIYDAVSQPSFSAAIVRGSVIDGENAVADAIARNTHDIIEAATLIINGEKIAVVDADRLELMLAERKNSFSVEGAGCTSEFVDDVNMMGVTKTYRRRVKKQMITARDREREQRARQFLGIDYEEAEIEEKKQADISRENFDEFLVNFRNKFEEKQKSKEDKNNEQKS